MLRPSFDEAVTTKAYDMIVQHIRDHWDDRHVIVEGLMAVQQCIDRKGGESDAKCLGVSGACDVVLDVMAANMQSEEIQFYGTQAFRFLATSSRNVLRFEAKRGLNQLTQSLVYYVAVPRVVREVLWALATLLGASEPSGLAFLEAMDGTLLVLKTLHRHTDNLDIQLHGCQSLLSMATRFKSRFREDAIASTGALMKGLLVRQSLPRSLVVVCLKCVTAIADKDSATGLFADGSWFRFVFITYIDDEIVVLEVVHLYILLCHIAPTVALTLSSGGGLDCLHEALVTYHNHRHEATVYELLRLVRHVFALSATHQDVVRVALSCQTTYTTHARLQIEVCCIVRLALPWTPGSLWTTQIEVLNQLMQLHQTDAILRREGQYTKTAVGLLG
ncbi:hypothetical protein H257_01569 [Aphanomyces astaci]|uniref:Uncharacterized protein n=1 Tax=Aphanomyces astaci TaxID=112090 RepID=W4H8N2_APHAT|nr:hypothetical protein H257_01569 [Aphanomyces astaci]ETV88277.1 hypothetical protein H257_01569 [Aphanomyces astaci]|eukprot:XP_009823140.1 hypothetical protein H257_01569 [Aphanomyces astaci]